MSSESQNNTDNQEIDLSQISKKIGGFFESISSAIFHGILFLKRNIVLIGIIFLVGAALGYYLDKTSKTYEHEIIVTPNFGSNDYLYSKINLLNSKIEERDTLFLKKIGIKDTKKINKIEIKPIIDIYKFIDSKPENFELIKLMAEDGEMKKIVEEKLTSKNYPFHELQISTSKIVTDESLVKPLMNYLNKSDYYSRLRTEYINNVKIKMAQNDSIIKQIDGFLDNFKRTTNNGLKSSNLVYYNDNMQLNDIIKTKDGLISEQGVHRLEMVNFEKTIKEVSVVTNIKNVKNINGKLKLVLPILFLFLFVALNMFSRFYRKQMSKLNN